MFHHTRSTPLRQFKPARAKKKTDCPLPYKWWEQKLDGQRFLIHAMAGGPHLHALTSRRESVETGRFVEKTDRVPHIADAPSLSVPMILDSELASIGDAVWIPCPFPDKLMNPRHPHTVYFRERGVPVFPHVSHTTSIMGSHAAEAVAKQRERGLVWAFCFDVLFHEDRYVGNNRAFLRRNFLASLLESSDIEKEGLALMPAWNGLSDSEQQELFDLFTVSTSGEGLMGKCPDAVYDAANNWWKWKAEYPADVVLTGDYRYGNEGRTGKMAGLVGTLEVGVYHDGLLHPIGWISAIMDDESLLPEITSLAESASLRGRVVMIRHNGLQTNARAPLGHTLRHPRFYKLSPARFREDKSPTDCTFEALRKGL